MIPQRLEHQVTDKGYVPIYATGVVEQPWGDYGTTDHAVWSRLYARQREVLCGRACDQFLAAMAALRMDEARIPRFSDLNLHLERATGWRLVAVEGLLPEVDFFGHLAAREFPVTWWIRTPEQMDYLAEPDLFHDLFGHVPLLMDPVFADYMCAYGRGGLKAMGLGEDALAQLARLYWYTVEFGLIRGSEGLRIYGSGILSSAGESRYAVESDAPNRIGFDRDRIMRTRYRIDSYQRGYFVIDSFEQLFEATRPDFTPIYAKLANLPPWAAGEIAPGDDVITRGTGEGWSDTPDA
ncbi:MAG TPA: phenylalanine 4-monooxygenase [Chiayiivirga sp.]|nr:phenylalanine 4-monooxygenase [Chiayiivirga sp.]